MFGRKPARSQTFASSPSPFRPKAGGPNPADPAKLREDEQVLEEFCLAKAAKAFNESRLAELRPKVDRILDLKPLPGTADPEEAKKTIRAGNYEIRVSYATSRKVLPSAAEALSKLGILDECLAEPVIDIAKLNSAVAAGKVPADRLKDIIAISFNPAVSVKPAGAP